MRSRWLLLAALTAGCTFPAETTAPSVSVVGPSGLPTSQPWGSWSAEPGERNVSSQTFLAVRFEDAVRVAFADPAFRGEDDPRYTVPIDGNVAIGWALADTLADGIQPTWTMESEVNVPLSAAASRAFVTYRILDVGSPLPAQRYRAGFVVEEAP